MKNVKQDMGKAPTSMKDEIERTSKGGATVVKNGPFDYSEAACEECDRIHRLKEGHDKGNYSNYSGSI